MNGIVRRVVQAPVCLCLVFVGGSRVQWNSQFLAFTASLLSVELCILFDDLHSKQVRVDIKGFYTRLDNNRSELSLPMRINNCISI